MGPYMPAAVPSDMPPEDADAPELDAGDPVELGRDYAALLRRLPAVNVLGGCCGTDHRHVAQIASACLPRVGAAA